MKVIIQLRSSPLAHQAAMAATPAASLAKGIEAGIAGFSADPRYPPIQLPAVRTATGAALRSLAQPLSFAFEPEASTYLIRGSIPAGPGQAAALAAASSHPDVVGVFSDPLIESTVVCPADGPVGNAAKVASLLGKTAFGKAKLDGRGVYLAIVDSGINVAHLRARGRKPKLDAVNSFAPQGVAAAAGDHPVDHGTMVAYDAGIMAPRATLLDHAVLLSRTPGTTAMAGLLSDAVLSYSKLRRLLAAMPASKRAMVVSNSWGMFSPAWDFPPGHPGNYSDDPDHPFNLIVAALEAAGADILFAAGNCGRDCPDDRCAFGSAPPICGANSHPAVISVAGVDVTKVRVGYSSQGPGRLTSKKPDISSYTHFVGSGVYPVDGGTSAACPVAAGVVAALRSRYPATRISPSQLRSFIQRTAEDRGSTGYDLDHGWGILDGKALKAALP